MKNKKINCLNKKCNSNNNNNNNKIPMIHGQMKMKRAWIKQLDKMKMMKFFQMKMK